MMSKENLKRIETLENELKEYFDEVECSWVRNDKGEVFESYITVRKDNIVYRIGFAEDIYKYKATGTALYIFKCIKEGKAKKRVVTENEKLIDRILYDNRIKDCYIRLEDGCLCGFGYEIELSEADIFNRDGKVTIFSEDCQEVFILDLKSGILEFIEAEIEDNEFGSLDDYKLYTELQTIDSMIVDIVYSDSIPQEDKQSYLEQFKEYVKKDLSAAWAISKGVFDDFRGYIVVNEDNEIIDRISY